MAQNPEEADQPHRQGDKHTAYAEQNENIPEKISVALSLPEQVQMVQILVDGVPSRPPEHEKNSLQPVPLLLPPHKKRNPPFHLFKIVRIRRGRPQPVIQILIARRRKTGVHPLIHRIHIQIVPCDIVDLVRRPVLFIVHADMGKFLRPVTSFGRRAVTRINLPQPSLQKPSAVHVLLCHHKHDGKQNQAYKNKSVHLASMGQVMTPKTKLKAFLSTFI